MKEIELKTNGGQDTISCKVYEPDKSSGLVPGVLFIHGWMSNQGNYERRAKSVAEKGAIAVTFDMRGHGASGGDLQQFSRRQHLEDVIAAYDYLVSLPGIDKNKIGVCGVSYGGYLAALLIAQRKVHWLALRVPALYKDDKFDEPTAGIIEKDPKFFTQKDITPKTSQALSAIANFTGDILLVESGNDQVIPHETIQRYIDSIKDERQLTYTVMENADHALLTEEMETEFISILSHWLQVRFEK